MNVIKVYPTMILSFIMTTFNSVQKLEQNERSIRFWDNYIQNLKSVDLTTFSDKLKVPVLVPIGGRMFFRGELIHTNEVTVSLGADYFVKCSLKQAEILRQHRLTGKLACLVQSKAP